MTEVSEEIQGLFLRTYNLWRLCNTFSLQSYFNNLEAWKVTTIGKKIKTMINNNVELKPIADSSVSPHHPKN